MSLLDNIPENEINMISKAATGFISALQRLLPGISIRSIQNAESKATKSIAKDIEYINKLNIDDLSKKTLIANSISRHSRAVNLANVITYASQDVKPNSNNNTIDSDWLNHFHDYAEKITTPDLQQIWGKILAGEINAPGSFSKRTLTILNDMNAIEAESFRRLCSVCITRESLPGRTNEPFSLLYDEEFYSNYNKDVNLLGNLGLLDFRPGGSLASQFTINLKDGDIINIAGSRFYLKSESGKNARPIYIPFSKYGIELSELCQKGNAAGYKEAVIDYLKVNNSPIKIYEITNWTDCKHFNKRRIY